ncbi:MAG: hypothetical protein ACREPF_09785, partial [Rhodanobacteraceae bacterium]
RRGGSRSAWMRQLAAVFMHRPYHHMPRSAWAMAYLAALGHDAVDGDAVVAQELATLCEAAGAAPENVLREWRSGVDGCSADALPAAAYPVSSGVLKAFRKSPAYRSVVEAKLQMGSDAAMELGNLYSAALPAWLAAGLCDAATRDINLDDRDLLLLGYGSGDAAEAIPARVTPGWREAAAAIDFRRALDGAVDLDRDEYATLHDTGALDRARDPALAGVVIDHIGTHQEHAFQDYGIAYYGYNGRL